MFIEKYSIVLPEIFLYTSLTNKTNVDKYMKKKMALGAIDACEKIGVTEPNVPVFFGVDGTAYGLEAVQQSKLAATVYNGKEGQ